MIIDDIREELFRLQDVQYRDFQSKLIPTVPPGSFIGVRTPALRKLAKGPCGSSPRTSASGRISANFWTRSRIFILMRISCTPFFSRK